MEINKRLVQTLFDLVVGSMDFGSGYMVDEEVEAMREVAVLLGVDPMNGTPENFKCKYAGSHTWRPCWEPVRGPDGKYLATDPGQAPTSWSCIRCCHVEVTRPETGTFVDRFGKLVK